MMKKPVIYILFAILFISVCFVYLKEEKALPVKEAVAQYTKQIKPLAQEQQELLVQNDAVFQQYYKKELSYAEYKKEYFDNIKELRSVYREVKAVEANKSAADLKSRYEKGFSYTFMFLNERFYTLDEKGNKVQKRTDKAVDYYRNLNTYKEKLKKDYPAFYREIEKKEAN